MGDFAGVQVRRGAPAARAKLAAGSALSRMGPHGMLLAQHLCRGVSADERKNLDTPSIRLHHASPHDISGFVVAPFHENVWLELFDDSKRSLVVEDHHAIDVDEGREDRRAIRFALGRASVPL